MELKRISQQRQVNAGYQSDFANAIKKIQNRQRRLTLLTLSMTLSFYATWTPYAIHSILRILPGDWKPSYLSNVVAILCAKSGTIINPVIYIFLNNDVSAILIIFI